MKRIIVAVTIALVGFIPFGVRNASAYTSCRYQNGVQVCSGTVRPARVRRVSNNPCYDPFTNNIICNGQTPSGVTTVIVPPVAIERSIFG